MGHSFSGSGGFPPLDLDGFLAGWFGNEDVLPVEAALLDHLDGIFETAEFGLGIVGAKGEHGAQDLAVLIKAGLGIL